MTGDSSVKEIAWRLLERKVLLENQWVTVECNRYATPDLESVPDYLVVRRRPFVVIVAEDDGCVLFIRQYRPATNKIYLCLPAGFCADQEDPTLAGQRELHEETGYEGRSFRQLGVLDPLPGYVSSPAHILHCQLGRRGEHLDPDKESLEVLLVPWSQILREIMDGGIDEMQAVAALLLAYTRGAQS